MTASGFQLAQQQAEAYEAHSGRFMEPSARLIVESVGLEAGDVVLDLACGTGLIARHAYPHVGPGGRVVGADVNPAMLAAAESLAGPGIEWTLAPAQQTPFTDAMFTHVICQQGFQFFPDTLAAAQEAHRVLRPGGTLTATIWATPGHNPYIETQLELLAELDDTITASARAATPSHADEQLGDIAAEAGFYDIDLSLLEHSIHVDDLEAFFIDQTATTPWAPVIARLSPAEQDQLAQRLNTALASYAVTGGHRLPFCSHMLTCRR
jgi:SAM-dependent methyltransferase